MWLDMLINVKKSSCLRIGPRSHVPCSTINLHLHGYSVYWSTVIRYLGVFISQSRTFQCVIDHVKRSFYRAANNIMGKIGRIASEEVTL